MAFSSHNTILGVRWGDDFEHFGLCRGEFGEMEEVVVDGIDDIAIYGGLPGRSSYWSRMRELMSP